MRIAVVTGASSGIGREFAFQIPKLYKNLDELWVVARRTERLRELEDCLGLPVRIFDGDLNRDYIFERIEKELYRRRTDIRMLVNSAGYGKVGSFGTIDAKEQLGMISLNCQALTKLTQICLPYMSRGSRLVNVASAAAFAPQPGFAVYAASKSYVYSLSQALRRELMTQGIIVTAVCPGPVDTEFFQRSGTLPSPFKKAAKADVSRVVRKALKDSAAGKGVSVYGPMMKVLWAASKLIPYSLTTRILKKTNHIE